MTYASEIAQTEQKKFAEIYEFGIGNEIFYYTDNDENITFQAQLYKAVTINRKSLKFDNNLTSKKIDISMKLTDPANRFIANNPVEIITVKIQRFFTHDHTAAKIIFTGEVIAASGKNGNAQLSCENRSILFKNKFPNIVYKTTCSHILFDGGCKLNSDNFKESGAVTVSANQLVAAEFANRPDGFFDNGFVLFGEDARLIQKHVGDTLTLLQSFDSRLQTGLVVEAFAGCNHLAETCKNKFDNFDNFRGFPRIPSTNPTTSGFAV